MWDRVVIIPAAYESELLPGCIESLAQHNQNAILILVLNGKENARPEVHKDNRTTFQWLVSNPHQKIASDRWMIRFQNLDILLLDRFSEGRRLGVKQGVGTARFLGGELACTLYKEGHVSYPWIWNTDADARFHTHYLDPLPAKRGVCIHPYIHKPAPTELLLYEASLRYYALGLQWAGSPYAFPTIGSTISIHMDTYEKSHGFPHKEAGEDFYLLNKAAKIDPVFYIERPPIQLVGRDSDRVPFGTGRGMQQIREKNYEKPFYHPRIFSLLKTWIQTLNHVPEEELLPSLLQQCPHFPMLKKLPRLLQQPAKGSRIFTRRHEWFDAFKTLRWIHHLEERFPPLPYQKALEEAPFIRSEIGSIKHLQPDLRREEEERIHAGGIPIWRQSNPS